MFSASDILLHSVMEAPYLPMRFFQVSSIVLLSFLLVSILENIQVLLSFYAFSGMLLLLPLHVLLHSLQRASISPIFVGVFPKLNKLLLSFSFSEKVNEAPRASRAKNICTFV